MLDFIFEKTGIDLDFSSIAYESELLSLKIQEVVIDVKAEISVKLAEF